MTHRFVQRPLALAFLNKHKHQPLIKVVSGIRRSGKTTLFRLFQDELLQQGVTQQQIISINFDDFSFRKMSDPHQLHHYILSKLTANQMNYLFIDEVQTVPHFEKLLDSLLYREDIDLYIGGSNSSLITELEQSMLVGRYITQTMLPLSFKEYVNWYQQNNHFFTRNELFNQYLKNSFPFTVFFNSDQERMDYLEGVYSTVVLNDIVKRLSVQDVRVLERLIEALVLSIGNLVTINKLKNKLKQLNTPIANNTIDRYINGILNSNVMYTARRFDIPSLKVLKTQEKYYMVDVGLQQLILNGQDSNFESVLENIVYLELIRRGYQVFIGKSNQYKIDFVALDANQEYSYYQVAVSMADETVLKKELKCLQSIHDYYPKYLLSLDEDSPKSNYGGIKKLNLLDWLLE